MGTRASPRLTALSFSLTPELLQLKAPRDPEASEIQALYERCYLTIFGAMPKDRLDDLVKETGCSLKLCMLAAMRGHHETSPQLSFYANMLLGPSAISRTLLYRKACANEFGTFDLEALDSITDSRNKGLEARILNSEIIAGTWVVGFKMRCSGPYGLPLYNAKELCLDPYWLAIEPSYGRLVLEPNLTNPTTVSELKQHRYDVSRTLVELKRHRQKARSVFSIREKIAPEAVDRVLNHFGFQAADFTTSEPVVSDLLKFWGRLALALKNHFVSRFVDGDRSALTHLRIG
jgi:hypothetical protein